ncbi:hypothetical protein AB0K48_34125, partial [Nonomuraea sp. NPDC055795]
MSDRYALLVPAPRHAVARPGSFTLDAGTLLHAEPEVAHLVRRLLHPLNLPLSLDRVASAQPARPARARPRPAL